MMRDKFLGSIALLSIAVTLGALPSQGAGLSYLSTEATSVVVGSVTTRVEGPKEVSFTIHVERVLDGVDPGPDVTVVHQWAGLLRRPSKLDHALHGMWFLKKEPSGAWNVLTARPVRVRTILGLFLPVSSGPPSGPYAYPADTPLIDVLTYEAAAGVQSGDHDPGTLLGAFDQMDTPAVRKVLALSLQSANPALRIVGVAGGLQRGMAEAFDEMIRLWPTIRDDPRSRADYVVRAFRDHWRDPDPENVKRAAALAAAEPPDSRLRSAATTVLAAIHTAETLPFLAELLDSPDLEELTQALYGLSAFANGCPMKTNDNVVSMAYLNCAQPSAYRTADTAAHLVFRPGTPEEMPRLVAVWRAWWNDRQELR